MKCSMMLHFIWVFTVCKSTRLGVSSIQKVIDGTLSYDREHFQILTYLIWALWVQATYLFTECVTKWCDPPDWLVQTCYQSASSRVTKTTFFTQKCFSVKNLIIVSLNTVIPIIVNVKLPKVTGHLHKRIICIHSVLVTFLT